MTLSALKIKLPRLPVAVEFTREGTVFVLLSLAIGAAAVNTGNNVLYLIFSIMLGLIVASGMISRRILIRLPVTIDFPDQIFAETPIVCYVSVTNRKRRMPALGLRLLVRQPSFPPVSRHFFFIPAGQSISGFAQVTFPHRGIFYLREFELQTRVPFGFFVKISRYFVEQRVCVYPRVYKFSEEIVNRFADGMVMESPFRGDSQQLLHLRDYNPLDSSRRIHWKASAKAEKLLVKEYQREQGLDILLYFDCYPERETADSREVFEKAIRFLASLVHMLAEKQFRCKVVFPGRSFDIGPNASLIPLLEYLAEMNLSEPSDHYPDITPDNQMVLCIRSTLIRERFAMNLQAKTNLYLEEWLPLIKEESMDMRVER